MDPRLLRAADFTYELPSDRIAAFPLDQRQDARLLVHAADGTLSHRHFRDVPELLPRGTLLCLNHTRVIQARLSARKASGGAVELLLLGPATPPLDPALALQQVSGASGVTWHVMLSGKRLAPGDVLTVDAPHPFTATVVERPGAQAVVTLRWEGGGTLGQQVEALGATPLPPYLRRSAVAADRQRYQTVYAKEDGSVAAPTAGLHFTPALLDALDQRGVERCHLTLHVGAGTFRPMEAAHVGDHAMHPERFVVTRQSVRALAEAHRAGRPVVAVGTTSLRTLESLYVLGLRALTHPDRIHQDVGQWEAADAPPGGPGPAEAMDALLHAMGDAEELRGNAFLMLAPGCRLRMVHGLFTNFHQPGSTLLLLVAAVLGDPAWKRVYAAALEGGYRFLSYGDGSLLWCPGNPPRR
jgi:S-adenosylmethionine:tRNA ribosyltransferase-isomerase